MPAAALVPRAAGGANVAAEASRRADPLFMHVRLVTLWAATLSLVLVACGSSPSGGANGPDSGEAMRAVLDELDELGPQPIATLPPAVARRQPTPADAVLQVLQRRGNLSPQPLPAVGSVEHAVVPGADGARLPARIYTPAGEAPFPVLVYFHGGGFVIGSIDAYDASCRALCDRAGAVVVAVEYRKAPEHKFPTAHEDAYAATQHVLANASSYGGDPDRVGVAGESAGGNLATGVCLLAAERGGAMPRHQLLIYPVVGASADTASYREHAFAKPLNAAMMAWFYEHYLRSPEERADRLVAPLTVSDDVLRRLPPATVITAAIDPLRSEGEAYAARLATAGVDVQVRSYDGVTHEFFGMAAVVPASADAQAFAATRSRTGARASTRPSGRARPRARPAARRRCAAAPRPASATNGS